jgi:hypothetical protein
MKIQIPSLLRRFFRPSLTVCMGLVITFGLTGCDFLSLLFGLQAGGKTFFTYAPLSVTASLDEAPRGGGPIPVTLSYSPALPVFDGDSGVLKLQVSVIGEDGNPAPGISVSPESFEALQFQSPLTVQVTIAETAEARPFKIALKANDTTIVENPFFEMYVKLYDGSALFFVRTGAAAAPRLTGITGVAQRGAQADVVFHGMNFDRTATFVSQYGIPVTLTEDVGPGQVRALIPLPLNIQTGELSFYVETAAGRSNRALLRVSAPRPPPFLAGLFPNYGAIGQETTVHVAGSGFVAGAMVVAEDGSEVALSGSTALLSQFLLKQNFRPTELLVQQSVQVDSLGRSSNPREFNIDPADFRGPRIADVNPDTLIAGALNQVEITWENYTNESAPDLIGLPNERFAAPLNSGETLTAKERGASNRSVAILDVPPASSDGVFHLAARTAEGRNTNLFEMRVFTPNPGKPFVQKAQLGRVGRDAEVIDTIVGERLAGVRQVRFFPPRFTAEVIPGTNTATSVQVRIRALEDAPLTGDERTVFVVETSAGRSNSVSYVLEAGGGTGSAPRIDLLAPNWVADGGGALLWIGGANFAPNSKLAFFPAGAGQPVETSLRIVDAYNLEQAFNFPAGNGSLAVQVVTPGAGQSNRVDFEVIDNNIRQGPQANFTGNEIVVGATRSQITVFGNHLYLEGGATTVIGLRTVADDELIALGIFYPNLSGASNHAGVVELQAVEPAAPVPEGGARARFTLKRGDGLTTHPLEISVKSSPATGPFVTGVLATGGGHLRRGTTRTINIFGRRLTGVTDIFFSQPGVSVTAGGINVIDDSEIRVSFAAEADAVITGDQVTSLRVSNGAEVSNAASFIVLP